MENADRKVSQISLVRIGDGEPDHLCQTVSLRVTDASSRCPRKTATPGLADGTD
ncbi:MAG: hypothetical protein ABI434_19745 [Burkholderiaceae bacterium]